MDKLLIEGGVPLAGEVNISGAKNAALPLLLEVPIERHREIMMGVSLALAERCDAILRLPGESSGADEEVAVLRAAGKPVWYSISEIPAG